MVGINVLTTNTILRAPKQVAQMLSHFPMSSQLDWLISNFQTQTPHIPLT